MKSLITTGKVLAILTIILGIAHEAATFLPVISVGMQGLEPEWSRTFTYFSLGCGGLLILCGVLFLMLLGRVERHEFLVAPLVAIGAFAAVDGVLAVCFMYANPFAWVVLALGVGLLFAAMAIRLKLHIR